MKETSPEAGYKNIAACMEYKIYLERKNCLPMNR